jgi:hypothetical protein
MSSAGFCFRSFERSVGERSPQCLAAWKLGRAQPNLAPSYGLAAIPHQSFSLSMGQSSTDAFGTPACGYPAVLGFWGKRSNFAWVGPSSRSACSLSHGGGWLAATLASRLPCLCLPQHFPGETSRDPVLRVHCLPGLTFYAL